MRTELPRLGHEVTTCPDGLAALKALARANYDAAILDIRMPGMNGIELLSQLKTVSPNTEVVMMTGHASMETAMQALRLGAFDYMTKPCKLAEIEAILRKISEKRDLQNKALAAEARATAAEGGPSSLIGSAPPMKAVQRLIATVAQSDATVLITGETGTGKELVARTIYQQSLRREGPFVPVNCGALSEHLVESELFGHRKGAFTGADRDHKGLFEVANGGTLFLDELGELNKNIQVKLLRFLESGEIRRVGETAPFKTDVRVLCATNRDLREMIAADEFREDLFFRVNTFEIRLPPLRERREDIPQLARTLLARAARRPFEQTADLVTPEAIEVLCDYDWPGNVRELANVMEYAFIVSNGQKMAAEHFPAHIHRHVSGPATIPMPQAVAATVPLAGKTLRDLEMEHILRTLEKNARNKPVTAQELGISLKTLYNKLNAYEEQQRRVAG
ncbi:MAG: sigma-54 dependent transcriptional regulator [Gemmataceae bacterium]|nr:sigma-54 dependent transcriptional regulator [Gemmataceae bacterium]